MKISELISEEAQDILNRSHRKQMPLDVEAENRLWMKTKIALAKMEKAKEKVEADEKGTYPKKEGRC